MLQASDARGGVRLATVGLATVVCTCRRRVDLESSLLLMLDHSHTFSYIISEAEF
jgi:hypothetical protein